MWNSPCPKGCGHPCAWSIITLEKKSMKRAVDKLVNFSFFLFLLLPLKPNNNIPLHRNTDVQPEHWRELLWYSRKFCPGDDRGLLPQHGGHWWDPDGRHGRPAHQQLGRNLPDWQLHGEFRARSDTHHSGLPCDSKCLSFPVFSLTLWETCVVTSL